MTRAELASLSTVDLVRHIFHHARGLGTIGEELLHRARGDQRTLELAAALDALSRLLREGTPPQALLAALTPLVSEYLSDEGEPVN
jgi:hypothetical protein